MAATGVALLNAAFFREIVVFSYPLFISDFRRVGAMIKIKSRNI